MHIILIYLCNAIYPKKTRSTVPGKGVINHMAGFSVETTPGPFLNGLYLSINLSTQCSKCPSI